MGTRVCVRTRHTPNSKWEWNKFILSHLYVSASIETRRPGCVDSGTDADADATRNSHASTAPESIPCMIASTASRFYYYLLSWNGSFTAYASWQHMTVETAASASDVLTLGRYSNASAPRSDQDLELVPSKALCLSPEPSFFRASFLPAVMAFRADKRTINQKRDDDDPLTHALRPPPNETPEEREIRLQAQRDAQRRSKEIDEARSPTEYLTRLRALTFTLSVDLERFTQRVRCKTTSRQDPATWTSGGGKIKCIQECVGLAGRVRDHLAHSVNRLPIDILTCAVSR